jgi:hypothetical protein
VIKKRLSFLGLFLALAMSAVLIGGNRAEAAPPGAALNQFVPQQSCQSNGLVALRFAWTPSGWGPQWIDVSQSPSFNGWINAGPLVPQQNIFDWGNLLPNTTYYSRIATWVGVWLSSDPIVFQTISCQGSFTVPTDLRVSELNSGAIRFRWDRGSNNSWYCLDTAHSLDDLYGFKGSWTNYACGTTATQLDIQNVACGREIYWRVFAAGPFVSGHSAVASFRTDQCTFTSPRDPKATPLTGSTVKFEWTKGLDNAWFCIDLAKSESDLLNFRGSFSNAGCGTTATSVDVTNLECNTKYWWRVFAQGVTSHGHSVVATVETPSCNFSAPHNLVTRDVGKTSVTFDWDAGNDNIWYCVDTAKTVEDLRFYKDSWKNYGCGTQRTFLDVTGLTCDTTYYWRVYARGTNVGGHSQEASFKTDAC